jgi:anti-sigma factor RsiW
VTCRDFADFIMDYLTGELPRERREPFERHLSRCDNCREYLSQYRQTIDAGKLAFASAEAELPPDVPAELVKAVLSARKAG